MVKWIQRAVFAVAAVFLVGSAGPTLAYAHTITQNVGNYTVPQGQTLKENINLNVGNVIVKGTLDGSVNVNVGNVVVSGLVTGDVTVHTGNIRVTPGGHIDGSRTVAIGNAASGPIPGGILGVPSHWASVIPGGPAAWGLMHAGWFHLGWAAKFFGKLAINLIVSALLIVLFPRMVRNIVHGMAETPVRAAAVGCLSLVAWLVAMIGLAVIIIGIPLTLLLALAGFVAALVANGAMVWLVGSRLMETAWSSKPQAWYWIVLAGGVAVTVVEVIPVIGPLAELAVLVVGVGAIVQGRVGFLTPPRSGGPNLP